MGSLPSPQISLVALWDGAFEPYLLSFFASFRGQNEQNLELIWVDIGKGTPHGCLDVKEWIGPNIKPVCIARHEYYIKARDYFCQHDRWHCTYAEVEASYKTMIARQHYNSFKTSFRLWRGYIFHEYMSSSISWWGWVEPNTFMGNFHSQFPWNARDVDLIIPSEPGDRLRLREDLGFVRVGVETERTLNRYAPFRTAQDYLALEPRHYLSEDADYSVFVFQDQKITFLLFMNHLVHARPEDGSAATFLSSTGTFMMRQMSTRDRLPPPFPDFPVLQIPQRRSTFTPTFSKVGKLRPIELVQGDWTQNVPFRDDQVIWYRVSWDNAPEGAPRIIGRGGGVIGGPEGVWERTEALPRVISVEAGSHSVELVEGLFARLDYNVPDPDFPPKALRPSEVLVLFNGRGAELWDLSRSQVQWRHSV